MDTLLKHMSDSAIENNRKQIHSAQARLVILEDLLQSHENNKTCKLTISSEGVDISLYFHEARMAPTSLITLLQYEIYSIRNYIKELNKSLQEKLLAQIAEFN